MNTTTTIIHTKYSILSAEHPAEAILLRIGLGVLLACTCLYLYFVSASVLNVIAREEAQRRSVALEDSVGVLQQEYFALAAGVSVEDAARLGLSTVESVSYVHRQSTVVLAR